VEQEEEEKEEEEEEEDMNASLTLTSMWGKGPLEFSGTLMGGITQSLFWRRSPLEAEPLRCLRANRITRGWESRARDSISSMAPWEKKKRERQRRHRTAPRLGETFEERSPPKRRGGGREKLKRLTINPCRRSDTQEHIYMLLLHHITLRLPGPLSLSLKSRRHCSRRRQKTM